MVVAAVVAFGAVIFLLYFMGGNNAANIIGPAIGARVLKFRKALLIAGISVFVGAFFEGSIIRGIVGRGIVQGLRFDSIGVIIILVAAAAWVGLATKLGWPVSISQSTIGAVIGYGIALHIPVDWHRVAVIFGGTALNPLIAAGIAAAVYFIAHKFYPLEEHEQGVSMAIPLVLSSIYSSYAMGANTFSGVVGVAANIVSTNYLFIFGTIAVALGILFFGKKVIKTAGFEITHLSPVTAFIAQLTGALVLHLFVYLGIPTSATLASVGAIFGIGLFRKLKDNVNNQSLLQLWQATPASRKSTIFKILFAWFVTPVFVAGIVIALYGIFI